MIADDGRAIPFHAQCFHARLHRTWPRQLVHLAIAVVAIGLSAVCSRREATSSQGQAVNQYWELDNGWIILQVPSSWKRADSAQEARIRQKIEKTVLAISEGTGQLSSLDFRVFNEPNDAACLIVSTQDALQGKFKSVEQMLEYAKVSIAESKAKGISIKAYADTIMEMNGLRVLKYDNEIPDGSRSVSIQFVVPGAAHVAVNVLVVCVPGVYARLGSVIDHITGSIRASRRS